MDKSQLQKEFSSSTRYYNTAVNTTASNITNQTAGNNADDDCPSVMKGMGVPTFKTRGELGRIMQNQDGATIGVELGVQRGGLFSVYFI